VANTDLALSASRLQKSCEVTYKLVHGNTDHVLGHDDGTVAVSMRGGRCDAWTYPETEKTFPAHC